MANHFSIHKLVEYLTRMNVKLANVDEERELIELSFHGNFGQLRMLVGLQQKGVGRKLILCIPFFSSVVSRKRLECLEALMAVNYRIALGKFSLDDSEVCLEESIPIANGSISFEQFQFVYWSMMQTVAIYHSLIPRIIYGDISVQDAIKSCEQEFDAEMRRTDESASHDELNVQDVLAEVNLILDEPQE